MFHVFRRLGNRIHDQILYYIRIFQVRNKIYTLLRTPAANYKFTPEAIAELRSLTQTYSNLRQGRLWRTWKLNKQFRFICCTCRRGYDTAPWSQTEAEEIERVCGKCRSGEQRTRRRRRVVRRVWNDDERWEMYKEVEWEVWKRRWRRAGRGILAKVGIREDVWTWIEAVIIGRL